jgi:hypothetical protein
MPSTHIQKFFTSRDNRVDNPDEFVGQEGRLWYDPDTNTIRVYTGDPGGMAVGGGGTGLYVKNSQVNDELVSKSKAIVYGIIF